MKDVIQKAPSECVGTAGCLLVLGISLILNHMKKTWIEE